MVRKLHFNELFVQMTLSTPELCRPSGVSKCWLEPTCAIFYWLDIICKDPHRARPHSCHMSVQRARQLVAPGVFETAHQCTISDFMHSFWGAAAYIHVHTYSVQALIPFCIFCLCLATVIPPPPLSFPSHSLESGLVLNFPECHSPRT